MAQDQVDSFRVRPHPDDRRLRGCKDIDLAIQFPTFKNRKQELFLS